jgi:hypothetical protein
MDIAKKMIIGVDFDNTIINYDGVFYQVACEWKLIPESLSISKTKDAVRNYLREVGKEEFWTEMQGYVYGKRLNDAAIYEGVLSFFSYCHQMGINIYIVSHKTQYPYKGPKYDLHAAAREWISNQGFYNDTIGFADEQLFFEPSKESKVEKITNLACTHFIDDLPEFLLLDGFDTRIDKILFDSTHSHELNVQLSSINHWHEFQSIIEREVHDRDSI